MNAAVDTLPSSPFYPLPGRNSDDEVRTRNAAASPSDRDPFTGDPLRVPRWRSFGLAAMVEILIALGLVAWFLSARVLPRVGQANKTVRMTVTAPPHPPAPPRPRFTNVTAPATAPIAPVLEPLSPITNGIPVPRALTMPAAPAPAAPPASSGRPGPARVNPYALYSDLLRRNVRRVLTVPSVARELGLHGRTLVEFRLTPAGHLLWARVARTSGMRVLDRAALRAVERARFPRFLARMRQANTTFELSVHLHA
jgi:TonB family protein